jgi:hypothetical protein
MVTRVGASAIGSFEVHTWQDFIGDKAFEFTADILAQKIVDDTYTFNIGYKVPASWWEHFKQDKMPSWFIKRYPVQYATGTATKKVKFTRYATYPMANIVIPKHRNFIELLGTKEVLKDVVNEL